jgi:hypothetical protein
MTGADTWSVDVRSDILLPQQVHWLMQSVSAQSDVFTLKAATIPLTQRFCSLLHVCGVAKGSTSVSAMRWDTSRNIYKVVQDSL